MKITSIFAAFFICISLAGCIPDSQNVYTSEDVGQQNEVEFGKVIGVRSVHIQNPDTGAGALVGAGAGAGIGHGIGTGGGRPAGTVIGLLAGAIVGGIVEHQMQNQKAIEYTIAKRNKKIVTIVQTIAKDDQPIRRGQRVMIQTRGHYQRVLPTDDLPDTVKRPKEIKVTD